MQQWFSNTEGHSQTSAFATMPFEEISSPVGVVSGRPYELSHPLVPGCTASLPHSENTWPFCELDDYQKSQSPALLLSQHVLLVGVLLVTTI